MIPYIEIGPLPLPGGIEVNAYGLLATTAVVAGYAFGAIHAPRHGIDRDLALRALWWTAACGLLAGHLGELLLYDSKRLAEQGPTALLDLGNGLSSLSGILGGALALSVYTRLRGAPLVPLLDLVAESFVVGWIFGRLGCSLAHDHPGRLSDFPLAVSFPGGPRHDLGLYEAVLTLLLLAPGLAWLDRRGAPTGSRVAFVLCTYAPVRFALDFLRATDLPGSDPRHGGLTPAQYGCVIAGGLGIALASRIRRDGTAS